MRWELPLFLVIICLLFFGGADSALGFGISPPWVYADKLVPGSHYEQEIYLTQANPDFPLKIEVRMDPSEIKSWFRFEPGEDFTIPAGQQQFPMRVIVETPQNAGYDTYESKIRIRAIAEGGGQVSVLVGGIVDVRLTVSGEEFSDFVIRDFKMKDIEIGWPIQVNIKIENLGNVKVRPSKVHLDIYDQYRQKQLQTGDATEISWVEAFEKGEIIAKMPTNLELGEYWAEIEIFKKGESILKDKAYFRILLKGSIKPYIVFLGMSIYVWGAIVAVILLIGAGIKFGFFEKLLAKFGISITVKKIKK